MAIASTRTNSLLLAAAAWLLVLGITVLPPLSAAQEKVSIQESFSGSTDVFLVEVPVNVFDRSGHTIEGLTADDFEVRDDGKEVPIANFEVVDLNTIQPDTPAEEIRARREIPAVARRNILLLFDLSFSTPISIEKARLAAREFVLGQVHPTDLVGVAAFSLAGGPRLLVTFTPDRAQVARAIDTLGRSSRQNSFAVRDPLRFMIDSPSNVSADATSESAPGAASIRDQVGDAAGNSSRVISSEIGRSQRAFDRGRITSFARSLGEFARNMNGVSGRKHVLFFSEGFDSKLLLGRGQTQADLTDSAQEFLDRARGDLFLVDTDERHGNSSLQKTVQNMLEEFRRADCIIQAVDIGGLRAGASMQQTGREQGQEALFYMANATGGQLFEDANDFGPQLAKALEASSTTYLLTFQPRDLKRDGSYRRIKVRLKEKDRGTKVAHRAGYYAPQPFKDLNPLEKSLLASDAIAAGGDHEIGVDLLAAGFRSGSSLSYVPVILEIEGASLLKGNEEETLAVEIYAYATNERGEMRDFFTRILSLGIGNGRAFLEKAGIKYYGHLDLPPGTYRLRVLVRNSATGQSGLTVQRVVVPAYETEETVLLPPFFLDKSAQWFRVRENEDEAYQRSFVYPFTLNGEPYIPSVFPALNSESWADLCLVVYNLGGGELELSGAVESSDGQPLGGGKLTLVERTVTGLDGVDKLHASFRPSGLETGNYRLRVSVKDPTTGLTQTSSLPFEVQN